MVKKILTLFLCSIFSFYSILPVFSEQIKGGIEKNDENLPVKTNFFTGEEDFLDEKDEIKMTVSQVLSAAYTQVGDEFFAEITDDVLGGKETKGIIVPKGSIIHGMVTRIEDPKNLSRNGYMVTVFDYIVTPDGRQIPIQASLSTKENLAKGTAKNVAKHAGVTVASGAIGSLFALNLLGIEAAITSQGMTVAGGAAVGGAIGLVSCIMSKGKSARINPGDELKIKMISDIKLPVMSKEAFIEEDIVFDGLNVEIYSVEIKKDPFDDDYILTLDVKISNMTNKRFYAFDIALMNEIRNIIYPSPLGDTSLWFKKIEPGDVVVGKLSFAIDNKKYKHWLVFYDRGTRRQIAKYSVENIVASTRQKGKKSKKNRA